MLKKIKTNFILIFLNFFVFISFSFLLTAKGLEAEPKSYFNMLNVQFIYSGENMKKYLCSKYNYFSGDELILKNKTSVNEVVNFYTVMTKIFKQHNIFPEDVEDKFFLLTDLDTKLKLSGNTYTNFSPDKLDNFINLANDINKNFKDIRSQKIKITEEDVKNAKNSLIYILKKRILKYKKILEPYQHLKFDKTQDFIWAGKILVQKQIESMLKIQKNAENSKCAELVNKISQDITQMKNELNDVKYLKKLGRNIYFQYVKNINNIKIPNLNNNIEEIENTKNIEIIRLTGKLNIISGKII